MNERSFKQENSMANQQSTEEATRRGERTRSEIAAAAHDLFIQQGYHGTSMRQIAVKAGIALGGLYNHFASKEDVFREVFLTYHPYREMMPAILEADGESVEQFMSKAIRTLMDQMKARPDVLNLMFIELVEFKSAHVAEIFGEIQPWAFKIIAKIQSLDKGDLRPMPPLIIMRVFVSVFLGFYLTEVAFGPQLPPEFSQGAIDAFIDVLLHGFVTTEG
jgi:AcrR family transcriptional regulator